MSALAVMPKPRPRAKDQRPLTADEISLVRNLIVPCLVKRWKRLQAVGEAKR